MTQEQFLAQLSDAIQRDEILSADMRLDSIEEWDSLAIVSLISLYDQLFKLQVNGNALRECQSVQDLINLAKEHIS